jgi:hypothetical protein
MPPQQPPPSECLSRGNRRLQGAPEVPRHYKLNHHAISHIVMGVTCLQLFLKCLRTFGIPCICTVSQEKCGMREIGLFLAQVVFVPRERERKGRVGGVFDFNWHEGGPDHKQNRLALALCLRLENILQYNGTCS